MGYDARVVDPAPNRSLVSWGSVFAGALIAAAVMTLLSLLWEAVASDNRWPRVAAHLNWWLAGSAIAATLLAGFFSAWLARGRGVGVGVIQALTEWGVLTVAVVIIVPGVVTAFRALVSASPVPDTTTILYTGFWAVLIGLGAALLGGLVGGALPSPVGTREVLVERVPAGDVPAEQTPKEHKHAMDTVSEEEEMAPAGH